MFLNINVMMSFCWRPLQDFAVNTGGACEPSDELSVLRLQLHMFELWTKVWKQSDEV